jgi:hypothetical protein
MKNSTIDIHIFKIGLKAKRKIKKRKKGKSYPRIIFFSLISGNKL